MLSIVMPAYNESEIIESTVREWYSEVICKLPGSELVVVNDCSSDNTLAILAALAEELTALRPLTPARNGGHGRALRFGFDYVKSEWIFQTDSDRQQVPSDFWKLWKVRENNDFVLGVRRTRADGPVRVVITTIMRLANFAVWGLWVRDANCPFKLLRREPMMKVLDRIPRDSFIPMVMFSMLCRAMGYRVSEVLVQHLPRRGGEQSIQGFWKWARVGSRCLRQLLTWRIDLLRGKH